MNVSLLGRLRTLAVQADDPEVAAIAASAAGEISELRETVRRYEERFADTVEPRASATAAVLRDPTLSLREKAMLLSMRLDPGTPMTLKEALRLHADGRQNCAAALSELVQHKLAEYYEQRGPGRTQFWRLTSEGKSQRSLQEP